MVLVKRQKQTNNTDKGPEIQSDIYDPHNCGQIFSTNYQGNSTGKEKTSKNGARTTGYVYGKKNEHWSYLIPHIKMNPKYITDLY